MAQADDFAPAPPSSPEPKREATLPKKTRNIGELRAELDKAEAARAVTRDDDAQAAQATVRQYAAAPDFVAKIADPAQDFPLADSMTMGMAADESVADAKSPSVERQLERIKTLNDEGEEELAKTLFDQLIERYPDVELPDDFPFEPPTDTPLPSP